jgi:hypothetical protein
LWEDPKGNSHWRCLGGETLEAVVVDVESWEDAIDEVGVNGALVGLGAGFQSLINNGIEECSFAL